jgi:hypothetical protein
MVALGIHDLSRSATLSDSYLGPRFFTAGMPEVEALGLGVVRAIDMDAHEIYISTCLPETLLQKVNTLLLGDMDLPTEIRMAKYQNDILPTSTCYSGLDCPVSSEDGANALKSNPMPYLSKEHRVTLGSGGLGNTHKAPYRENGPGNMGRRNDLIRW